MKNRLKTAASAGAASALLLALLTVGWAASPKREAAHPFSQARRDGGAGSRSSVRAAAVPAAARFRESERLGLLVETWVNGSGPFTFALDTGAGATILSRRTAAEARVEVEAGARGVELGGLSGRTIGGAAKAFPRSLALGSRENLLPSRGFVVVAPALPEGLDGVLDPSESYHPLGFVVDMPRGEIRAFDPRLTPLRAGDHPPGGATLRWLTDGRTRRPFVALDGGRRALLDTGSAYGLAVDEHAARSLGIEVGGGRERGERRDIAGGSVAARRIRPATVNLGPLALRRVPTDLLLRAEKGAPVILGRDALRPFEIIFDPASRLVMLKPGDE
ncbi:MAG TPA: pepsin/retropepsin-like aspartic protease family protein [Pyrinomonadaceae bacterium]|nr:pepsin/retropepsin-like aspartic protease family protein [Pyrinomonadaceae bacterium]